MAQRAWAQIAATDESGEDIDNGVIAFTNLAGGALGQSLYAAQSGGSPETTHTTDNLGTLDRYVDAPTRALYTVNGGVARVIDFMPHPSDILIDGDTQARTLDGYTGTDPVLKLRSRNASGTGLLIANTNDDTVVHLARASGNDVLIIGDDGTKPTTTLLYVTKAITASDSAAQRIKGTIGTASLSGVGTLEVILENNVASSTAKAHAGLVINSSGTQTLTEGLLIHGTGGHQNLIKGYAADNSTVLFSVSGSTGAITSTGALSAAAGTFSGVIASGSTPATTGQIRLPNNTGVVARNAANSGNIVLILSDAVNNVTIGATTNAGNSVLASAANVLLQVGANAEIVATTAGVVVGRSGSTLGYFAAAGATKQTVTGSKGANAALTSLLTALAAYGIITDSSS